MDERKNSKAEVERYDLEILLRRPSLRTNIPRRISQIHREAAPSEETSCGIGCIRGEWLQSFASRKAFILIYGALECFYGSYYAYFYGVITTLEKQFKTSSQTIGLITTAGDVTQTIMCLILAYWTPKTNRPKWIGFGIYIIVASTIISTLPHFLSGSIDVFNQTLKFDQNSSYLKNETETEEKLCFSNPQACVYNHIEHNSPIIFLLLAHVLHGIGGSLSFILGASYKDDNTQKYQAPSLLSFLSILKTLGPAFGYWLSSMCLKIFVWPTVILDTNEDSPRWIGAWWLGYLIIGFMLVIFASLTILFPSTLPATASRRILDRMKRNAETKQDKLTTIEKLGRNPSFKWNNFNNFNILGFMAYFIFLPKYVEIQYQLSASTANFFIGSVTLIFSAFGILIASSVITKYRPKARVLAGWNVFVDILSIGSLIFYIYVGCPGNDKHIKAMVLQLSKNNSPSSCNCDNYTFSPVCSQIGTTFVTPCHAGCEDEIYINNTRVNCSSSFMNSSETKTFFEGSCPVDCYFDFVIFFIITCSVSLANATSRTSNFWIQVKYVEKPEKYGIFNFVITLFGVFVFAPSSILFGYILDNSCLLWERKCNGTGNCWLYDTENLRYIINLTAMGFVVITTISDIIVWYFVKNLKTFADDQYADESEEE